MIGLRFARALQCRCKTPHRLRSQAQAMSMSLQPGTELDALRAAKQACRQHVKGLLKQLTQEEMTDESQQISSHVLASQTFKNASYIGIYLHCARLREVDTTALVTTGLASGKRCYVPLVEDKSSNMRLLHLDDMSAVVSAPPFGILEPKLQYADGTPREDVLQSQVSLDLLLMPGLGFDSTGRRLGRGGGYYDKMLARLQDLANEKGRQPPLLVALAYSAQLVEEIPADAHDIPIDVLVTPQGIVKCSHRGQAAFH